MVMGDNDTDKTDDYSDSVSVEDNSFFENFVILDEVYNTEDISMPDTGLTLTMNSDTKTRLSKKDKTMSSTRLRLINKMKQLKSKKLTSTAKYMQKTMNLRKKTMTKRKGCIKQTTVKKLVQKMKDNKTFESDAFRKKDDEKRQLSKEAGSDKDETHTTLQKYKNKRKRQPKKLLTDIDMAQQEYQREVLSMSLPKFNWFEQKLQNSEIEKDKQKSEENSPKNEIKDDKPLNVTIVTDKEEVEEYLKIEDDIEDDQDEEDVDEGFILGESFSEEIANTISEKNKLIVKEVSANITELNDTEEKNTAQLAAEDSAEIQPSDAETIKNNLGLLQTVKQLFSKNELYKTLDRLMQEDDDREKQEDALKQDFAHNEHDAFLVKSSDDTCQMRTGNKNLPPKKRKMSDLEDIAKKQRSPPLSTRNKETPVLAVQPTVVKSQQLENKESEPIDLVCKKDLFLKLNKSKQIATTDEKPAKRKYTRKKLYTQQSPHSYSRPHAQFEPLRNAPNQQQQEMATIDLTKEDPWSLSLLNDVGSFQSSIMSNFRKDTLEASAKMMQQSSKNEICVNSVPKHVNPVNVNDRSIQNLISNERFLANNQFNKGGYTYQFNTRPNFQPQANNIQPQYSPASYPHCQQQTRIVPMDHQYPSNEQQQSMIQQIHKFSNKSSPYINKSSGVMQQNVYLPIPQQFTAWGRKVQSPIETAKMNSAMMVSCNPQMPMKSQMLPPLLYKEDGGIVNQPRMMPGFMQNLSHMQNKDSQMIMPMTEYQRMTPRSAVFDSRPDHQDFLKQYKSMMPPLPPSASMTRQDDNRMTINQLRYMHNSNLSAFTRPQNQNPWP